MFVGWRLVGRVTKSIKIIKIKIFPKNEIDITASIVWGLFVGWRLVGRVTKSDKIIKIKIVPKNEHKNAQLKL